MTYAENVDRFWAVLTGHNQIIPNPSDAVGFVGLKFTEDYSKLVFNINVDNIDYVTGIYLYDYNKDQNRTVILDLMEEAKEQGNDDENIVQIGSNGKVRGTISVGGVTADDLQGALKGKSLKHLYSSIVDGTVYVCVHTKGFPDGEISTNSFIPIDRVFPDVSDFKWN